MKINKFVDDKNLYNVKCIRKRHNPSVIAKTGAAGITLIALVITIIVLIILAGITINLVLGENGIIEKAKEAVRMQEEAELKEQIQMEIVELEADRIEEGKNLTQEDLETILSKYGIVNKNTDGTIKSLTPKGKDYEIPFEEIYDRTLSEETIQPSTPEEPEETTEMTARALKAGDYVKYDTGVSNIGEIVCRVLYEADSKYGLQIIANKKVADITIGEDGFWEEGKEAYNGAIELLNGKAEDYLNEEYATDARCVGSVPTIDENGKFVDKNSETKTPVSVQFDVSGWDSRDSGCKGADKNYVTDWETMNKIGSSGIHIIGQNYWLASREVISTSDNCDFDIRYINTQGIESLTNLCSAYHDYGLTYSFSGLNGLRPCFALIPDLKISLTGDGKSEATAYTVNK